jgi:hydrogenase-4 component E
MSLKGGVFPLVLSRVMRDANVRREVEPFVGSTLSIIFGVLAFVFSMWLASRLLLSAMIPGTLMIPSGLATMFIGLFVIVSRRKALTQVLGYIVMENGIYALGVALAGGIPLLVEFGVLLDAFVAVFIMSIAAYHVNREFDHLDVDQLDSLKD